MEPRHARADLHVHSCHSLQSGSLRFLKSRDCYSKPEAVYRAAKARGMDLVTITDHDSIGGCLEFLEAHPDAADFFVSEEVSCLWPGTDLVVHFGVYGMTERLHAEIQPLRRDAFEMAAALRDAGVVFSLNHLLHFYRGQIPLAEYLRLLEHVPALESRNGTMLEAHNELVARIARQRRAAGAPMGQIGGSDAHTLRRIGRTWTSAPGRTPAEYLRSLADGLGDVGGTHGTAATVAGDAYGVIAAYVGSLVGFGPADAGPGHRLACLAFSIVSAPAQFLPYAIAAAGKRDEARQVGLAAAALRGALEEPAVAPAAVEAGA